MASLFARWCVVCSRFRSVGCPVSNHHRSLIPYSIESSTRVATTYSFSIFNWKRRHSMSTLFVFPTTQIRKFACNMCTCLLSSVSMFYLLRLNKYHVTNADATTYAPSLNPRRSGLGGAAGLLPKPSIFFGIVVVVGFLRSGNSVGSGFPAMRASNTFLYSSACGES